MIIINRALVRNSKFEIVLYLLKDKTIFKAVSNISFNSSANFIKRVHIFCGCNICFDGGAKFPLMPGHGHSSPAPCFPTCP